MPEHKKEVKPYLVNYRCDKCNVGVMVHKGIVKLSNPPRYEHVCHDCGSSANFNEVYPLIRHI